ncbi:MAG: autotransporter adhesin family protein [Treponemataceae bacterium]|nr:autotransporter adhesin family protein [Treponemataceae bacterium]
MPKLVYAALLYKDGDSPENPPYTNFIQGTSTENAGETKLNFSFQKPDDTNGTFTLEIFAFEKTSDEDASEASEKTPQFSKETALLSGSKTGLSIVGDTIEIDGTIALAISSTEPGTVSLKIKVPEGCSLEIDDTTNFDYKKDDSASDTYTVSASGISTGAYQMKFTVKKKVGESEEIVHIFSEYINVINGFCTDTWGGLEKGAAKEITPGMISSTVYVRGSGGWYDKTEPYKNTATASDSNSGSFLSPLETIQKAIDKIIAINDGASEYTIYVDGTFTATSTTALADFNGVSQTLSVKVASLSASESEKAVLNGNNTAKCVYVGRLEKKDLNLTLENLVIKNGNSPGSNGGGIFFNGKTLEMTSCEVIGCEASNGGGVYIYNGTFKMEGGTISDCTAKNNGGGVCIDSSATFEMSGTAKIADCKTTSTNSDRGGGGIYSLGTLTVTNGTISKNTSVTAGGVYVASGTFTMEGGTISENKATTVDDTTTTRGGGVYVSSNGKFEMSGGTISDNTSSAYGGGVYTLAGLSLSGDGEISNNKANYGGGVYVSNNTFTMSGNSTILNNEATKNGGGVFVNGFIDKTTGAINKAEFEMSGGMISGNKAVQNGRGVYVCSDTNNGVTAIGTFMMSGMAKVAEDNDVRLYASGSAIPTITVAGDLTASSPVATITPSAYTANRQVLSAGDGVTLNGSICDKFTVTPQADGTEWRVALDGAAGVLIRKYEMGDTGPGGGYVFHYSADGFTVNGKTCHYLECSKEQLGKMTWCPCFNCEVSTSSVIGAGYANTQAILNHPNHASATATNCAAKACAEYSTSTTTAGEWFLPTTSELSRIVQNLVKGSEKLGTFNGHVWSSLNYSNAQANVRSYSTFINVITQDNKNVSDHVWAARAF